MLCDVLETSFAAETWSLIDCYIRLVVCCRSVRRSWVCMAWRRPLPTTTVTALLCRGRRARCRHSKVSSMFSSSMISHLVRLVGVASRHVTCQLPAGPNWAVMRVACLLQLPADSMSHRDSCCCCRQASDVMKMYYAAINWGCAADDLLMTLLNVLRWPWAGW